VTSSPQPIRLVVTDVDGTLTDGILHLGRADETKTFSTKDGAAFGFLRRHGIHVAIVSGRRSDVTTRRAVELGVEHIRQPVKNKREALEALAKDLEVPLEATAFFGDDLTDLPAMVVAGFSVAPADAAPEVQARASLTTKARGGRGAFRAGVESILRRDGLWDAVVAELAAPPHAEVDA